MLSECFLIALFFFFFYMFHHSLEPQVYVSIHRFTAEHKSRRAIGTENRTGSAGRQSKTRRLHWKPKTGASPERTPRILKIFLISSLLLRCSRTSFVCTVLHHAVSDIMYVDRTADDNRSYSAGVGSGWMEGGGGTWGAVPLSSSSLLSLGSKLGQ